MVCARLACQGRGLVDHVKMLVLIGDHQRKGIGLERIDRRMLLEADRQHLALPDKGIHRDRLSVQRDAFVPFGTFHGRITYAHDLPENIPYAAASFCCGDYVFHLINSRSYYTENQRMLQVLNSR